MRPTVKLDKPPALLILAVLLTSRMVFAMQDASDVRGRVPAFHEALESSVRAAEISPENDIYAPLLGSWDVQVVDYPETGEPVRNSGEWHFARVLEGRAVQDVWIVPPRGARFPASRNNNRYGSSLRIFDPARNAWKVIWVNPVTGVESHLRGHREGNQLVHVGRQDGGDLYRWTFSDISNDSFNWSGEASSDDGETWRLEAEFFAQRKDPVQGRKREILWRSPDGERFEHLSLVQSEDGYVADGLILRHEAHGDTRIRYRISVDKRGRTRSVRVEKLDAHTQSLNLHSNGEGHWWKDNGETVSALDGCIDVDLQASPFTNTIAIRRLELSSGQAKEIRTVFVHLPELEAVPARQRYTRIEDNLYRYEGMETGFVADLPVDHDGLLIEYPGYFKQAWSR